MSWRTVIVSSHAKLDLQVGFMQIRGDDGVRRIILDEIDVLMVESTAVSLTAALLAELVERKVRVIFCDRKRLPVAELTPCHGCHDSSRRLKIQLAWTREARARVWQLIVKEKICNQAALLQRIGKGQEYDLLLRYAQEVGPGDRTNREGVAAKTYFSGLFGSDFTREKRCDINSALDYGYEVMLSVFAREVAVEGYVTELGIFHDNVYNSYNLASDLIEPFRPLVDAVVRDWFSNLDQEFDKDLKRKLVGLLHEEVRIDGTSQTVINAIISYTRSVTDALMTGDVSGLRFIER